MTLALDGSTAWVACKEDSKVVSLDGGEVELGGQAIAVLSAFDAIWALDDRGTLYRIEDSRIAQEIATEASAPYTCGPARARSGRSTTAAANSSASTRAPARSSRRSTLATGRRTWSSPAGSRG
jgi:hypothetical protein